MCSSAENLESQPEASLAIMSNLWLHGPQKCLCGKNVLPLTPSTARVVKSSATPLSELPPCIRPFGWFTLLLLYSVVPPMPISWQNSPAPLCFLPGNPKMSLPCLPAQPLATGSLLTNRKPIGDRDTRHLDS